MEGGESEPRGHFYLDGVEVSYNEEQSDPNFPEGSQIRIGDHSDRFELAHVAVYDQVLDSARIAAHLDAAAVGGYADEVLADNPIGYWQLAEGEGVNPLEDSAPSSSFPPLSSENEFAGIGFGITPLLATGEPGGMRFDQTESEGGWRADGGLVIRPFTLEALVRFPEEDWSSGWVIGQIGSWGFLVEAEWNGSEHGIRPILVSDRSDEGHSGVMVGEQVWSDGEAHHLVCTYTPSVPEPPEPGLLLELWGGDELLASRRLHEAAGPEDLSRALNDMEREASPKVHEKLTPGKQAEE